MNEAKHSSVSGVFVFMLLGLFALLSVLMVLLSAQTYRSTVLRSEEGNTSRVLTSFVRSSLTADDAAGVLSLREEAGVQVICFSSGSGEETYLKRLYCWDGALRELYTEAGYEFDPSEGEMICRARGMTASVQGKLLTVVLTDDTGAEKTLFFALRTPQA